LPTFGQPVYLRVPRRQFYCRHCQKYVTEKLDFIGWRRRATERYESYIYQRILQSNIEQVSREEDLTYDEAEGIFKFVSNQRKKKDWGEVKRLSMDEVSKRKGARDFITVVSDVEQSCLLEVIDSHKQQDIIEALKQQPIEVRTQVMEVSVDMWAGFPKIIAEVFPNAAVVIDRFHVMKLVLETLNKIRRLLGIKTKGSKYLLLKNHQDLTESEPAQLEQILSQSPCLRMAYEMKEEFREIYETSKTVPSGMKKMQEWLVQAQVFSGKTAQTIREHLSGRVQLLYQWHNQWSHGRN
jgi:transposase